ncbi:MAG: lysozyme [Pseudomonadota bacterium]
MRTSERGLELIKSFEGFYRRSVSLGNGRWVVGYGHTKAARAGLGILKDEAEAVLRDYDLPRVERRVTDLVHTPVNQNQFDALVSFAFNIGAKAFETSAVLAHLNAGEHLQAADAIGAWRVAEVNGEAVLIDALVRRRAAETALFLTPAGCRVTASSAKIRPQFDETRIPLNQLSMVAPSTDVARHVQPPRAAAQVPASNGLVPTASEDMALAVKERLVRILGEPQNSRPAATSEAPAVPTPDDITKAISAIADPDAGLPIEDQIEANEIPKANGRIAIDDLEPAEIDPDMVRHAMARQTANTDLEADLVGPLSYSFYGGLAVIGMLMGAVGLTDLFGALGTTVDVPQSSQYAGFGLSLLGAFMVLIAVYFIAKSMISAKV